MTPHEYNTWLAFILLGLPLASIAGPFAWTAIWILAACALLATHPIAGFVLAGLWLLRTPLRWLVDGVAQGLGARLTGVFNSPERAERAREKFVTRSRRWTISPPKGRGRRPRDYMPFDDPLDLGD